MSSESRILGEQAEYVQFEGEVASGQTVYPGMVLEVTGTTSTAGADTPTVQPVSTIEKSFEVFRVALTPRSPPHANDSDIPRQHEYDAGEHVEFAVVFAGYVQNALLANGNDLGTSSEANVSFDAALAANDDGALKEATGTSDAIARAREAVDNASGGGSEGPGDMSRIAVEVL